MEYKYTKIYNKNGENYFLNHLPLNNNTVVAVNITQGTKVKVVIDNVTDNESIHTVVENFTYLIPGIQPLQLHNEYLEPIGYLRESFDNKSVVESFINASQSINSPYSHFKYTSDDNYIYSQSVYNYSISTDNTLYEYNIAFNWHTGWLEHYDFKSIFVNNTIIRQIIVDRVSNDLVSLISSNNILILAIGTPFVILVVIGYVWLDHKKKNIKSQINVKPNYKNVPEKSFSSYFKKKLPLKNKSPAVNQSNINSSLDKLEQIIEENNNKSN